MTTDERDSTERTRTELERRIAELEEQLQAARAQGEKARRLEQRLHTLTRAPSHIVWITTADGALTAESSSLRAFTGMGEEEILRHGWLKALHLDEAGPSRAAWERAQATRQACVVEQRIQRHDGAHRDVELRAAPVAGEDGEVHEWVWLGTDVTERNLAKREQRFNAERFWQMIDGAPIGMALVGLNGLFIRVNRALGEMLGYAPEELVKLHFQDITHPDDLQIDVDLVDQVIRGEIARYDLRKRYVRKDGSVVNAVLHVSMVRDELGEPIHFISQIVDMTEQERAAAAVIESQRARLAELSTPLIPLGGDIMIMPLIGAMDPERTAQVLDTLLAGIAGAGAHVAILDITGVVTVDEQVASGLLQAARAVRLLGAQMVLSGIRPDVARTLVAIGADLSGIVTYGNLQAAIAHAMKAVRRGA